MSVVAMFRCNSVLPAPWGPEGSVTVSLNPVADEGGRYKEWSEATPSGDLRMVISNPAAADWFKQGTTYLLTFEAVEATA